MTEWISDIVFSFDQNRRITSVPCPDCPSREGEVCVGVPQGSHHFRRVQAAGVPTPIDVGLSAYLDEAQAKAAALLTHPPAALAADLRAGYLDVLARALALLAVLERSGRRDILDTEPMDMLSEALEETAFLILVAHHMAARDSPS